MSRRTRTVTTRSVLGGVFAITALGVIGWQVGANVTATGAATSASSIGKTYTGDSEETRFGAVQVEITVAGGKITNVVALHLTDADGRSVQISNNAAPLLRSEVLAAQSATVDTISGATYTTEGYLSSLQSALDKAGLS